jgi:hypothetical protein
MATYAISAMTPSIARTDAEQQTLDDDPRLPKVFEACIVACQCMITVCLAETDHMSVEGGGMLQRIRTAKQGEKYLIEVLIGMSEGLTIPFPSPLTPHFRPLANDRGIHPPSQAIPSK